MDHVRPRTMDEALTRLGAGPFTIVAGCTDHFPLHAARPARGAILDITALDALRGIRDEGDPIRIGALTTWTDIVRAPLPPAFDGLKDAARRIGGIQVQNVGTVGGNLCNASPAADGVPVLLTLDARIELAARSGTRTLPLADFITGVRRTARRPDELLTAILVPRPAARSIGGFVKLGARSHLVISIAMAAGRLTVEGGVVTAAAFAVGACSPVARRLPDLEATLIGRRCDPGLADHVLSDHLACLSPIDDIRGTAAYRRDAALTLLRRLLADLTDRAGGVT